MLCWKEDVMYVMNYRLLVHDILHVKRLLVYCHIHIANGAPFAVFQLVPTSLHLTCQFLQIVSDVYLQSHERGRRHQEALSCLPDPQSSSLIITLDEEGTAAAGGEGSKVTHDQLRASRKRLRKLRQRITTRSEFSKI